MGDSPRAGNGSVLDVKKVEAVIKLHKLEDVKVAMQDLGIMGLTAWEVKGFGREEAPPGALRGRRYRMDFMPKAKIEVVVDDDEVSVVERAIVEHARTDTAGDGLVFVYDCVSATRIGSGEHGAMAL